MSKKKSDLISKCVILMVINIFLTFYVFGMPKIYENKDHFTVDRLIFIPRSDFPEYYSYFPHHNYYYKLDEDITATDLDGEEVLLKKGEFMFEIDCSYQINGGTADEKLEGLDSYVRCQEHRFLSDILDEADCHEALDEYQEYVGEENKVIREEGNRDYIKYRLKNILWFIPLGNSSSLAGLGIGIVGAAIAIVVEMVKFVFMKKKDILKAFVAVDMVTAGIITVLTILYLIFPMTCK